MSHSKAACLRGVTQAFVWDFQSLPTHNMSDTGSLLQGSESHTAIPCWDFSIAEALAGWALCKDINFTL